MAEWFERFMGRAAMPLLLIHVNVTLAFSSAMMLDGGGATNLLCHVFESPCVQGMSLSYYWFGAMMAGAEVVMIAAINRVGRKIRCNTELLKFGVRRRNPVFFVF